MPNAHHQQRPREGGGRGAQPIRFEIPRRAVSGHVTAVLGDHHTLQSRDAWKDVPPGHRFQLYFHGMADKGEVDAPEDRTKRNQLRDAAEYADWQTLRSYRPRTTEHWVPLKNQKRVALRAAAGMGKAANDLLTALADRTRALRGPQDWHRDAELIAPLATGLGNPHPVENGFAFLSPYGVSYLAGSGVKGVLRRAAEELALFDAESPWTIAHVWVLFGFDENSAYLSKHPEQMSEKERKKLSPVSAQRIACIRDAYDRWAAVNAPNNPVLAEWKEAVEKQFPASPRNWRDASPGDFASSLAGGAGESLRRAIHWQGLLAVQDAFPDTKARMEVDILNPHHREYFEGNGAKSPHDAENPVPVFFLTVAPGARFTFSALPLPGREALWQAIGDWKSLLDDAFDCARDWLGFGAKTAVGYGAMTRGDSASKEVTPPLLPDRQNRGTTLIGKEERWEGATLKWEPGPSRLTVVAAGKKLASLQGVRAKAFTQLLPEDQRERLLKKRDLKPVSVIVEVLGNQITPKRPAAE